MFNKCLWNSDYYWAVYVCFYCDTWAYVSQWHFYPLHTKAGSICGFNDTGFVYSTFGNCADFTFVFAESDTSNWVVHTRNSSFLAHTSHGDAEPWALQFPRASKHVLQCSLLQLWPNSFLCYFVHAAMPQQTLPS